jgi:hypothetical protein
MAVVAGVPPAIPLVLQPTRRGPKSVRLADTAASTVFLLTAQFKEL